MNTLPHSLLALLMLLGSIGTSTAQVLFREGTWEQILRQAADEHKHIFVDVYTSWCGPCKRMNAEVFPDSAVSRYLNERFVSIRLDAEKQASHPFFRLFKPGAYPTYYWLDADGELLDSRSGYMPAPRFLQAAQAAAEGRKGQLLRECRRRWAEGERDTAFVADYLFEVLPRFYPDSVRPLLNAYLAGLPDTLLQSAAVGRMVIRFNRDLTDDAVLRTFLTCHPAYRRLLPAADVDKALYLALVRLPMMHLNTDHAAYESDLRVLQAADFPDKELYRQLREAEQMLFAARYAEGLRAALDICRAREARNPSLYGELCYTLIISRFFSPDYRPSEEEERLSLELAAKAFELQPSQATLSYLAAAHARQGNYEEAYRLAANLPIYDPPTLSNAVYPLMGIPVRRP